jgi:L-amino acid N-acyltransferase YncA
LWTMRTSMEIRDVTENDAIQIAGIYNHYIATSHATFELEPIDAPEMERRIAETVDKGYPFFVAEDNSSIAGYTYGRPFRPRPGYRHAVEVAVYIDPDRHRQGIGKQLYDRLLQRLFADGAHTIIATIALPNDASVRMHEQFGFIKAGQFREVGRKFGIWIDVGYWQLLSEND